MEKLIPDNIHPSISAHRTDMSKRHQAAQPYQHCPESIPPDTYVGLENKTSEGDND